MTGRSDYDYQERSHWGDTPPSRARHRLERALRAIARHARRLRAERDEWRGAASIWRASHDVERRAYRNAADERTEERAARQKAERERDDAIRIGAAEAAAVREARAEAQSLREQVTRMRLGPGIEAERALCDALRRTERERDEVRAALRLASDAISYPENGYHFCRSCSAASSTGMVHDPGCRIDNRARAVERAKREIDRVLPSRPAGCIPCGGQPFESGRCPCCNECEAHGNPECPACPGRDVCSCPPGEHCPGTVAP